MASAVRLEAGLAVVAGATVDVGAGLGEGDVVVDGEVVADPQPATRMRATSATTMGANGRRACRGVDMAGIVARVTCPPGRAASDVAFLIACPVDPERPVPTVFLGRTRQRFYPSLPGPGVPIGQALPVFPFSEAVSSAAPAASRCARCRLCVFAHAP